MIPISSSPHKKSRIEEIFLKMEELDCLINTWYFNKIELNIPTNTFCIFYSIRILHQIRTR